MLSPGPLDSLLARALREPAPWPDGTDPDLVRDRAVYHGIAGLLTDRAHRIADWPAPLRQALREQALAQSMWELRHRAVLNDLLAVLAAAGVETLILKGTALAWRHYPNPAARARGDSDLLIHPADRDRARAVLRTQGYHPVFEDLLEVAERSQEPWSLTSPDGSTHAIDLHWSAINGRALEQVLPVEAAFSGAQPLPRLGPRARGLPDALALVHACVHRAQHITSPYFVGGEAHYGDDRLIWLQDIDLLMRALLADAGPRAADIVLTAVGAAGIGPTCAGALTDAQTHLDTPLPEGLLARLSALPEGAAGAYLRQTNPGLRALQDLGAAPGLRTKLRYLAARLFPPASVIRASYPGMARSPLILLYLRRLATVWLPRRRVSR